MAKVQLSENSENQTVTISIRGRFDFSTHKEFRAAYKDRGDAFSRYVVNMRDVEYIDSSALGMLLLLREHAKPYGGNVVIKGCKPGIEKILKIANFGRLFDVC